MIRIRHITRIALTTKRFKTNKTSTMLPSLPSRTTQTHQVNVIEFTKKHPASQKRMRDSYVEDFLRFKSDPGVYEGYRDLTGKGVLMSKILEDVDALAAMIGFAHAQTNEPIQVVTASVDRIDLLQKIPNDRDIRLSGFVTFVGSSSMEVSIRLETVDKAPKEKSEGFGYDASFQVGGDLLLEAKFIMVAIDPATAKPHPVPPLQIETAEDKELFTLGAAHKAKKQVEKQLSLKRKPPVMEEIVAIHQLYLDTVQYESKYVEKPKNVIWMNETRQNSLLIALPQERNLYNKIFGGYLMRVALELAYSTCLLASKSEIRFLSLDDISFHKPVNVGSIVSLSSVVSYTHGSKMQVDVIANVVDVKTSVCETTNEFHFVFESDGSVPTVIPRSYKESVAYIEGKRRLRL
jgi:acyl-coenzyme A thioesterase 9